MFLLVPAHPGFPGQIPQSRKTVVVVVVTLIIYSLFCTLSVHSLSLLIRSSSVLAIAVRSSAYNGSHGKVTLNSVD